ncbi:hypothetical protein ACVW0B_001199 [Thermostichus sp. MS-CIW-23]|jgi:hypothetical protein
MLLDLIYLTGLSWSSKEPLRVIPQLGGSFPSSLLNRRCEPFNPRIARISLNYELSRALQFLI